MASLLDFARNEVAEGQYKLAGDLGTLVVEKHPSSRWSSLASLCARTPCTLYAMPMSRKVIRREVGQLLNRVDPNKQLFMTKTPDSLLFTVQNAAGAHRLASVLHDSNMYMPPDMVDPSRQAVIMCVSDSGVHLTPEHDVRPPHCISRCCTFRHIAQQLMAMRPLEAPRVVFHTPSVGRVTANMLHGESARALTQAYASHLDANAHHSHLGFDQALPMKSTNDIVRLLMLRNPERVKMRPCADGLMLYRDRSESGTKTLVALVNSSNTQPGAPLDPNAPVQLHKFEYSDQAKQDGFRFNVTEPSEAKDTADVHGDLKVQEILNRVGHVYGEKDLNHVQCADFVPECASAEAFDFDSRDF